MTLLTQVTHIHGKLKGYTHYFAKDGKEKTIGADGHPECTIYVFCLDFWESNEPWLVSSYRCSESEVETGTCIARFYLC